METTNPELIKNQELVVKLQLLIKPLNNAVIYRAYKMFNTKILSNEPLASRYYFDLTLLNYVIERDEVPMLVNELRAEIERRGFTDIEVFGKQTAGEWFGKYKTVEELNANIHD